jgi:putative acetyltransferase
MTNKNKKPLQISITFARTDNPEAVRLIEELDAYLTALYPPDCNHLLSAEELLKPNVSFFIAKVDGATAGCGALINQGDYGEIKRMYIRPEFRGTGVAVKLLRVLEEKAKEEGLSFIRLETGNLQFEAVRFYGREGYASCGAFGGYTYNLVSLFFEKYLFK